MNKDLSLGIFFGFGFFLIIFTISLIFAVGYHRADDVHGGNFTGNFIFEGKVNFENATIIAQGGEDFPIGAIIPFSAETIPVNWTECDGKVLNISDYVDLFLIINTTYGGDGITNFSLPDLRGEFIRGFDDGRGVDSGRALGSFQGGMFQDHGHSLSGGSPVKSRSVNDIVWSNDARKWYLGGTSITILDPNSGNYGAETRPRNIAMKFIIKVK